MTPLDPITVPLTVTNLIEASAGTGKTHTITNLYVRMLLELRLYVSQILVVTYTNAATAELRTRVRRRLHQALAAFDENGTSGDEFLDQLVTARRAHGSVAQDREWLVDALHGFDEAAIFTIHGFCQRMLQENAFESAVAFDTELISNQSPLLTEVVQDFWVRELHAAPEAFVRHLDARKITPTTLEHLAVRVITHPDMPILPAVGAPRDQDDDTDLDTRLLQFQLDFIEYARRELRRRKEQARQQSFDDLLHRLAEALRGPGGATLAETIRQRFHAALIDEFQDTDPIQYEIFRRVYLDTNAVLFLIGDPKQAIYAFRGADVFAYIQAKHDAASTPRTLNINRRADPHLVEAVGTLFGRLTKPFVFDDIPFIHVQPAPDAVDHLGGTAAGQPPLRILYVDRTIAQCSNGAINKGWGDRPLTRLVAREIVRFLESGATIDGRPVEPGDIAVLCRKNKQAALMQETLRELGVPTVLQTEASVFEAPEAAEMQRVLMAMVDPADSRAIRAALCTPMLGQRAADLCALDCDEQRWDDWVGQFSAWHNLWTQHGFIGAFRALLDSQAVQPRLLGLLDGERRLTNVLHLMELLHAASTEERRGPHALVQWLTQMRTDSDARAALAGEAAQIRLESDAGAVKLTTVHKSKGLQYPIVYCPYLWDGALLSANDEKAVRFHDAADHNALKLDIGSSEHRAHTALAEHEVFAENLRLLYVALTRAQHCCTVVWGPFRDAESSALGYLLHQPRGSDHPRAATAAHIKSLRKAPDDRAIRAELETLAASAPDAIGVADLSLQPVDRYQPIVAEARALRCRVVSRALPRTWRVSSFSALAASGGTISEPAETGLDHDATIDVAPSEEQPPQPADERLIVLHDFPRGTRAGQLVHQVLQDLDFDVPGPIASEVIAQLLGRFGFEGKWTEPLSRAIADVLATTLADGATPLRLRDIPSSRRLNELEFILPVADESPTERQDSVPLTAARLADVFTRYAASPVPSGYAEHVRNLGFSALAGFLRGFIDLVFEHNGRWYVVDYKSNMLGPRAHDYEPAKLIEPMSQHHYFLQYHLYVVALHRYLASRLPDYDYDRHFGGIYYLFLRGMAPGHAHHNGVFHDRPPRALIERLSAVLAGE
ncbi:MAG: exodeoxyribonuclease V subunit beta [Deltaproteobacteria bacterium]|nr:exodeoxyribonuclease V subunit beta [Deltaproteobacteria bacterium]MBI3387642.1 exodeoxyribonuclease V subunit beta [Deltaproteobacteria bacterium]